MRDKISYKSEEQTERKFNITDNKIIQFNRRGFIFNN